MASIRWSVDSRKDLRAIFDYIARDSLAYASATIGEIVDSIEHLRKHPNLGRMVPEYGNPAIRELIVMGYRVVYRVAGSRVAIAAIVHGSRDLVGHLTIKI